MAQLALNWRIGSPSSLLEGISCLMIVGLPGSLIPTRLSLTGTTEGKFVNIQLGERPIWRVPTQQGSTARL